MRIQVRTDLLGRDLMEVGDEAERVLCGSRGIVTGDVQLSAIARRYDDRLTRGSALHQRTHRDLESTAAEVQPLAQLDRGRPVTCSNQKKMHLTPRCSVLALRSRRRLQAGRRSCGCR